jgi:chromosome partitioning protein
MRSFAVFHIKGGVGKTSAAVQLAHASARSGARTLLWDLDPQGAATFLLRVSPGVAGASRKLLAGQVRLLDEVRGSGHPDLDVLPSDPRYERWIGHLARTPDEGESLAERLHDLESEYDHVFLDCAAGLTPVSEAVFRAAQVLLAPCVPTPLSLRTLAQLMKHVKGIDPRPRVLPFFSLVDRRKLLHRSVCAWSAEQHLGFLATEIPYSSVVEQAAVQRRPLAVFAPASPAAQAYQALWSDVQSALARANGRARWRRPQREALERMARRDPRTTSS